ncbi:MAG: UDP-N-acetylmuramate dehydrogenase [Candidatus Binatia bacterium]
MAKASRNPPLAEELNSIPGAKLKIAEPLARYTSMKVGGPADYFIEVVNDTALANLLRVIELYEFDFCLLGNGSNVLISDRGVRGAVIRLAGEFKRLEWREENAGVHARVGAAYAVTQLVREAARKGYTGLEFAEGIPGTVGGALFMNAGAYGSEFEKIIVRVQGIARGGQPLEFSRHEMNFSYRDSHLPAGTVVTHVEMRLQRSEMAGVGAKVRELTERRKGSQPSGFPNSGSMFRNPPGDFAGRLIEAAGLKGRRIGQCQISERHANFFVNLGGAKAVEVRRLMELAQAEVRRQFGVELAAEVKFLGEWPVE